MLICVLLFRGDWLIVIIVIILFLVLSAILFSLFFLVIFAFRVLGCNVFVLCWFGGDIVNDLGLRLLQLSSSSNLSLNQALQVWSVQDLPDLAFGVLEENEFI